MIGGRQSDRRFGGLGKGCAAAFLLAAVPVSAQEPTIDQLLATPTAEEIATRWKSVCFDHAGDPKAQRATVAATGLTWPYQAMVEMRGKKSFCVVTSSTKVGSTVTDFAVPLGAATGRSPETFKRDGDKLSADIDIDGKAYWIAISSSGMPGNLVSSIVLAVK